jgi:hypothetical protein
MRGQNDRDKMTGDEMKGDDALAQWYNINSFTCGDPGCCKLQDSSSSRAGYMYTTGGIKRWAKPQPCQQHSQNERAI